MHFAAERSDVTLNVGCNSSDTLFTGKHIDDVPRNNLALEFNLAARRDGDLPELRVSRRQRPANDRAIGRGDDDPVALRLCGIAIVSSDVDRLGQCELPAGGDGDLRNRRHTRNSCQRGLIRSYRLRPAHREVMPGSDGDRARCPRFVLRRDQS